MAETREKIEKVSNLTTTTKKNQMEILELKNLIVQMKPRDKLQQEWRQGKNEWSWKQNNGNDTIWTTEKIDWKKTQRETQGPVVLL